MATKIIHKKSSVASSVPSAEDLEPGEIAVNLADKKIYSKTTGGTVIELAPNDDQLALKETAKNVSGGSITIGTPVYQSGSTGNAMEVQAAASGNSSTMPAVGILVSTLADQAEGEIVLSGFVQGLNTSSFSAGDTLYVDTSGGLTATAPSGESNLIQNIGKVIKVHASNGSIMVTGAGRSNATPNLNDGNIFIGNGSNQSSTASFNDTVDAHLNYSTATSGQVLSYNGSDYDWVNIPTDADTVDGLEASQFLRSDTSDTMAGDLTFGDSGKAIFGAGSDLSVYHDGSNSYIKESGAGALKVTSNGTGVDFESAGGETLAQFETDGAVTLYYNNNQKLATTSTGIDVSGFILAGTKIETEGTGFPQFVSTNTTPDPDIGYRFGTADDGDFALQQLSGDAFNKNVIRYDISDELLFYTDNSERVRIDSSGNVGIATSSPAEALDVTGNAAVSNKIKIGGGADADGNADELVVSKDINNVGMSLLAADATGVVRLYLGSQTDTTAASIRHSENLDRLFLQSKGDIYFQTTGNSTIATLNSSGDLDVTGALSKGSGSFKIDHPLKPDTHHLVHSFIEGPQADNIYRGRVALVDGTATVNLDTAGRMTEGTFTALNGSVQCFTTNEQGWTAVRGSVSGNLLTIEAQDAACTDTVSWMVIGERHDQHMIDTAWTDATGRVITEPEKPAVEENDLDTE